MKQKGLKMNNFEKMIEYYNKKNEKNTNYEIIDYILSNLPRIDTLSTKEIAEKTFVSKATITRFIRTFGYDSFYDF